MTGMFGCNGGGTSTETVGVVGTVVSPDNRAVAGVPVVLMDTILGDISGSRNTIVDTTDEYGRFTLRIEYFGSYLLAVKDTTGRVFMEEVDITDYDTSLGMLTVNTPGSLNGCIFDDSMKFTANPRVILYKKDIPFKYQWARGAFTIDSLAPGEVRVQIGVWVDDYSRANKWIVFFDSTVFISPGAATAIDTVFINDAALQKIEDSAIAAFDPVLPFTKP
jgi:hypothetical protein